MGLTLQQSLLFVAVLVGPISSVRLDEDAVIYSAPRAADADEASPERDMEEAAPMAIVNQYEEDGTEELRKILSSPQGNKKEEQHQTSSNDQRQLAFEEASQEVDAEVAEAKAEAEMMKYRQTAEEDAKALMKMQEEKHEETRVQELKQMDSDEGGEAQDGQGAEAPEDFALAKAKTDRLLADHRATTASIRERVMQNKQLAAVAAATKANAARVDAMAKSHELVDEAAKARRQLEEASLPCFPLKAASAQADLKAAKTTQLERGLVGQHAVIANAMTVAKAEADKAVIQSKEDCAEATKAEGAFNAAEAEYKAASDKAEHAHSKVSGAEMKAKRVTAEAVVASSRAEDLGQEKEDAYLMVAKTKEVAAKAVTDTEAVEYRATAAQGAAATEVQESHRATQKAFQVEMEATKAKAKAAEGTAVQEKAQQAVAAPAQQAPTPAPTPEANALTTVVDPATDNQKCGDPSDGHRVFKLKEGNATESACKQKCDSHTDCVAMSGIWSEWCIGCSEPLQAGLAASEGAIGFVKK